MKLRASSLKREMNKSLPRLIKEKKRELKVRNRREVITNTTEIHRIIRLLQKKKKNHTPTKWMN